MQQKLTLAADIAKKEESRPLLANGKDWELSEVKHHRMIARGVYLAAFPVLPRNLECITVTAVTHEPIAPYHVITHKRNRPVVTRRFP